jgi:two-component system cell cycle sensor histidine kinase/response regulator CckA
VRRSLQEVSNRDRTRELTKRLQQAQNLETVGTLAGGIAHDFNNILTIIKGHASILQREYGSLPRVREICTIIDHASHRGSDLVKEMLAFARKSEGIFSLADFNKLVRDAAEMFREPVAALNVRLELALDASLPQFVVDTGQVERIVINLITNARDAMPDGGRIVLSTGRVQDCSTVPCLAGMPVREYAYLQVSDDGAGMDEATRNRIFEPFFTTKAKGKGTGLGMPVVYGVMQMHHGTIDVTSVPGQGTTIALYFPIVAEEEGTAKARRVAPTKIRGNNETLLVVDDEPDVLSFLRVMLEAEGYRVLAASNAEEALEVFHAHRNEIKLLFSDLGLPTMSGYELGELLHQQRPGFRTLLGSGYADSEIREQLEGNPYMTFVSKPYSPDEVLMAISSALDQPVHAPAS